MVIKWNVTIPKLTGPKTRLAGELLDLVAQRLA